MSTLPLWWSRELDGEPPLVGRARSWVAELLPACAPLDDLLIFTSELATNAVTHTRSGHPGGRFTVEVTWSPQAARVVVGDQGSHEVPAIAASAGDQAAFLQSGRGLLLIDTLSAAWGIAGDATARWLWADVHWRSQGGPLPTAADGDSDAARHLATLHHAYPGTTPWYSPQSGQWHAILPGARDAPESLTAPRPRRSATWWPRATRRPASASASHPEGDQMHRPRPLRDYPAGTLDALQSAITALLLGYQDMLPTDLSVKLDIFRYDVSQAIGLGPRQATTFTPAPRRHGQDAAQRAGTTAPARDPDRPRALRGSPYPERHPR